MATKTRCHMHHCAAQRRRCVSGQIQTQAWYQHLKLQTMDVREASHVVAWQAMRPECTVG